MYECELLQNGIIYIQQKYYFLVNCVCMKKSYPFKEVTLIRTRCVLLFSELIDIINIVLVTALLNDFGQYLPHVLVTHDNNRISDDQKRGHILSDN